MPDLAAARDVLALAGRPRNGRVMLDTWHLWCAAGTSETVRRLPAGVVTSVQVSDAPRDRWGSPPSAAVDRLLPGEGSIPLATWLQELLVRCPQLDVVCETLSRSLKALPLSERLLRARDAMRRVVPTDAVPRGVS
ncbi:hypothetical protein KZZ52_16210 [Dactylosporangium sp. AC04546]|uniref:hypothetical protein n=1 Tax=Dactylosporangium sp. AC04546 TaxID=2862460 RepID=UPI001EDCBEF6|nr:hypothetical protein [Dactylosporangium sp. AC04546]WVK86847.1 hypothetical protein KZZ52_16210 [Dactylosporangium sp. AC04546]